MKMLSLGIPSTLGNWLMLCQSLFGKDSKPTKFILQKIADSPNGEEEEVIADEKQLLHVLGNMFAEEMSEKQKDNRQNTDKKGE
jgi:hypothetical protein